MGITPKNPADFDPSMGSYNDLRPFRFWCQKVLPLVYDDSLSYYEVLCKVVDYLNKTMEDVGVLHEDVDALHTAYQQLQAYVNDYFSTLDVQQEINNKLDVMASDGTLDALLLPYFNAYKAEINQIVANQNENITAFKASVTSSLNEQNQRISTLNNNVNTLSGRMDTFTHLTEGSTTGDAELIDIRVGANGVTYNSAGDAVRGQYNVNHNEIVDARTDSTGVVYSSLGDAIRTPIECLNDLSLDSCEISNYDPNNIRVLEDRALSDYGTVAYSVGNNLVVYENVVGGELLLCTVPVRPTGTYKVTFAFYSGPMSTDNADYLVGDVSFNGLNNTIIKVPTGATRFVISQSNELTSEAVKTITPTVTKLSNELLAQSVVYIKTNGTDLNDSIVRMNYYGTQASSYSLEFKALNGYKGWVYPVKEDTYFYCDNTTNIFRICTIENGVLTQSQGTYTITGNNPTEYSSAQLPTIDNKLLVPKGSYIIVTSRVPNDATIYVGVNALSNDLALNSRQILQAKSAVVSELEISVKTPICKYDTNNLHIYLPAQNGYVRYDFTHNVNASINADIWRINNAYHVSDDLYTLSDLTTSGEWECALHLSGRPDFSGGIAHGDEVVQSITFLVDGDTVSVSDLSTQRNFTELRIIEYSLMYDPNDNFTPICKHGSEHIFNKDGLTINQSVEWLGSFETTTCYMAMFPAKKNGDDKLYMDTNYDVITLPENDYRNAYNGAKSSTIFSANANYWGVFEVPIYVDGTGGNQLLVLDNGGLDYHKMYYVVTTGMNVSNGTLWKTRTKYKLDVGA